MRRTTVMLDDELYRAVKRKAVDRGRPMRALVEEAIRRYLGLARGRTPVTRPKFRVFQARVLGSLRREDIYAEHIAHKYHP